MCGERLSPRSVIDRRELQLKPLKFLELVTLSFEAKYLIDGVVKSTKASLENAFEGRKRTNFAAANCPQKEPNYDSH